ncbi:MAG: glycosyltransferase family 4 protein [Candidatus Delongbacteria bacterium]
MTDPVAPRQLVILCYVRLDRPGGAAWSRLLNYARAFVAATGGHVHIFSSRCLDLGAPPLETGVAGCLAQGRTLPPLAWWEQGWPRRRLRRWLREVLERIRALGGECSVLVVPNNHELWENRLTRRTLQEAGLAVYLEKNELELGLALHLRGFQWNRLGDCLRDWLLFPYQLLKAALLDRQISRYQGVVVISRRLEAWVAPRNPNLVRVPVLMDEPAPHAADPPPPGFQIGFTGSVSQRKEGLGRFIRVLGELRGQLPDAELQIYGKWQTPEGRRLRALVRRLDLEARVHFHGERSLCEIQRVLGAHHLLILPRPRTLQNEYGFSTKLAGYLGSGVATLATAVSDNADYLQDGVNGFLLPSDRPERLRAKLLEIYGRRGELAAIGERGRQTALQHFHFSRHGERLAGLLRGR